MDQILKKAKIEPNPNIIAAATDAKSASSKRVSNIIFGVILIIVGVLFLFSVLGFISLILSQSFGGLSIFLLFMVVFFGLFGYGSIRMGMFSISSKSDWFLILYEDHLLYKYRDDDDSYRKTEIPLDLIEKCFILCKRKIQYAPKGNSTAHILSIHFQYTEDEEQQFISLYYLDGYDEMNKIITYLNKTKKAPVYYVKTFEDKFEELSDIYSLKNAEEIDFTGSLEDYHDGTSWTRL